MNDRRAGGRRSLGVKSQLALFYTVAAGTMIVLGAGAFLASANVAKNQALDDAERQTSRLATSVIAPPLSRALAGDPSQLAALRDAIQVRISDQYITEVTVWDVNGLIVFSDDLAVEGDTVPVPDEAVAAIRQNETYSAFEDQPEVTPVDAAAETSGYVEVYVPMPLNGGPVLSLEVYYNYDRVDQAANSILWNILPLVFVPLVLLQIIQVPIAASLSRRVRRQEEERAHLLELALEVSDRERVRIAADLHDGPIQDLAGIGYALGALVPSLPEAHQRLAGTVGETLHHAVDSLRRMMVDIYPPDLTAADLSETIEGLAVPLREEGIVVEIVSSRLPDLDAETVTALYRVARESVANVARHAQATRVQIGLAEVAVQPAGVSRPDKGRAKRSPGDAVVRLTVADNGVGFAEGDLDRRAEGHLGLRLLMDRVRGMGGTLTVESMPTGGTTVTAVMPVRSESERLSLL